MWLPAAGKSLWPLLRGGETLKVERVSAVRVGDVAVVMISRALVAHFVISVNPLRTAASNGRVDQPADELLGRVIAFRRDGIVHPWPAQLAVVFRWLPSLSRVVKRVPGAKRLISRLRDF